MFSSSVSKRQCLILAFLLVLAAQVNGQNVLKVARLTGSVKVQRADKRNWVKLEEGEYLSDNDIVETFFQAKLILTYKRDNMIILGSNSKALINLSTKDPAVTEINTTLFSGGIFVKAVWGCKAGIFTSNGVAETDSGVVSAVVEAQTGHTGFQVLGGSTQVRNISQQESSTLTAGQTTVILPGKQPTAPLYITDKHVLVLRHFFGHEHIAREMKVSRITPTKTADKKRVTAARQAEKETKPPADIGSYKALFSLNKIYGAILTDREKTARSYTYFKMPEKLYDNKIQARFRTNIGFANGGAFPIIELAPSFNLPMFGVGLRLPLIRNAGGQMGLDFTGFGGVLDKIDYLRIDIRGRFKLDIGPIEDYTIGNGVVVDRFSNKDAYSVLNTTGLTTKLTVDDFHFRSFIADLSSFKIGGVNLAWEPSFYRFGVGYCWDSDMYVPLNTKSAERYTILPDVLDSLAPNPDSTSSGANIWEIDVGVHAVETYNLSLYMDMGISGMFRDKATTGLAVKGPRVQFEWRMFKFGLGFNAERGEAVIGHFHPYYMSNRLRLVNQDSVTLLRTQNNIFSGFWDDPRRAYGINILLGFSPAKGTSLNLDVTQDFAWRSIFQDTLATGARRYPDNPDSGSYNGNLSYNLTLAMNEKLIKQVKYAEIFARQVHGGYYPQVGSFFANWGVEAGFNAVSNPLFFNISLEAGMKFYYLDMVNEQGEAIPNNNLDAGDNVIEVYVGARWGFM